MIIFCLSGEYILTRILELFNLLFNLQTNGKALTRIGEGPILTLERIERQQAGVYQCNADNGVGEPVNVDMRLDVLCKFI